MSKFAKLTPNDDVELGIYKEAIDFVFSNEDLLNIAISGPYSSGKSSVVKTYIKNSEHKFLSISLSNFQELGEDSQINSKSIQNLEGRILNQLIYQIEPKKIPQTIFKKKIEYTKNFMFYIFAFLIFINCTLLTLNYQRLIDFKNGLNFILLKDILGIILHPNFLVVHYLYISLFLLIFLYKAFEFQRNTGLLKKISIKGTDIEVFSNESDSFFDKYLNEVIYIFTKSDAKVIVFEDMDRFESDKIFHRLREINTILNRSIFKEEKLIRFFYLIRDDIFDNKDRTKFFDFIIPIVPILDSSNSQGHFLKLFSNYRFSNEFDEGFLENISLYIDDMRILKNIYNELVIYDETINTTEQNINKILALIIYKNLFPKDFSNLQLKKGFLYTIFKKKSIINNKLVSDLKKKVEEINIDIRLIKKEILKDEDELNIVYNTKPKNSANITEKEERIRVMREFKEKSLSEHQSIKEEYELLLNDNSALKLSDSIKDFDNDKIIELIDEYIDYEEVEWLDLKSNLYFELIIYLLRSGYIDETYNDYLSSFIESNLSRNDKLFLRSVNELRPRDYKFKLDKVEKVYSYINEAIYSRHEVLNIDLIDYLLNNNENQSSKIQRVMLLIKKTKNFEFINSFFEVSKNFSKFSVLLFKYWPECIIEIIENVSFNKSIIDNFLYSVLKNADEFDILNQFSKREAQVYVENDSNILSYISLSDLRIFNLFIKLGLKFSDIEGKCKDENVVSYMYDNDMYQLTLSNIYFFLELKYNNLEIYDYRNGQLLTSTFRDIDQPLFRYIHRNIINVIEEYTRVPSEFDEDENVVLSIINDERIDDSLILTVANLTKHKFINLSQIVNIKLWSSLIENMKIEYTENNIIDYYIEHGQIIDTTLEIFINSGLKKLNFLELLQVDPSYTISIDNFINDLLSNEGILEDKFKEIIQYYREIQKLNSSDISKERLNYLISNKKIVFNEANQKFIRDNYPDSIVKFYLNNFKEYLETISSNKKIIQLNEVKALLESSLSNHEKYGLLKIVDSKISIKNSNFDHNILRYILKYYFDISDLSEIVLGYSNYQVIIKKIIYDIVIKNIQKLIVMKSFINDELLEKLIVDEMLTYDEKKVIFINSIQNLKKDTCIKCFKALRMYNYSNLLCGSRPKFEINVENETILNYLIELGYISSYDRKEGFYRAFPKKM